MVEEEKHVEKDVKIQQINYLDQQEENVGKIREEERKDAKKNKKYTKYKKLKIRTLAKLKIENSEDF